MVCNQCGEDPCACSASTSKLVVASDWLVRQCVTPGCTVMIRSRVTNLGNPHCKWCQAGTAYYVR
jgi:hypothetical protein